MPSQHYQPETYRVKGSIGYLLKRAHALLVEQIEPLFEKHELNFTQWVVLMYLRDGMAINATVLCAQLRHDSGALTRILDQLERRGLLQRQRSRVDRRAVQLHLTDEGRALIEGLVPEVVAQLNRALGGFSAAELAELVRLLTKLTAAIEPAEADVSATSPLAELADGERS